MSCCPLNAPRLGWRRRPEHLASNSPRFILYVTGGIEAALRALRGSRSSRLLTSLVVLLVRMKCSYGSVLGYLRVWGVFGVWNQPLASIRHASSVSSFKSSLKTCLYFFSPPALRCPCVSRCVFVCGCVGGCVDACAQAHVFAVFAFEILRSKL